MKRKSLIVILLTIFLSLSTFARADDIYNNERGIKIKADIVGGIAIPGVKIVIGDDNTDGGYLSSVGGGLLVHDTGYLNRIREGDIPGHSFVKIRGHNHLVGTVDEEVSALGTLVRGNWPAAAAGVRLVSTDVDDDGDPADTGARTVFVWGLDEDWLYTDTTVTMDGTTLTVASAQTFIRLNGMIVLTAGTPLGNEGDITASIGGVDIIAMYSEHPSAEPGRYSVAANEELYLENLVASAIGNKEGSFHMFVRDTTIVNSVFVLKGSWHSNEEGFGANNKFEKITEKSDVLFTAHAVVGGAVCSINIEGWKE